jgi:hypothetical protein
VPACDIFRDCVVEPHVPQGAQRGRIGGAELQDALEQSYGLAPQGLGVLGVARTNRAYEGEARGQKTIVFHPKMSPLSR